MDKHSCSVGTVLLILLLLAVSSTAFAGGLIRSGILLSRRIVCTEQIVGVVDEVTTRYISSLDEVETRYLDNGEGETKIHIALEPDGAFNRDGIYASGVYGDELRTEITIHYSPKHPDNYYINDWLRFYRNTGIFTLVTGVLTVLLASFLVRAGKHYK
ncbi:MAG: hypothetical protein IJ555_14210 [Ruminococcus sp.]|nr:hypothetical protein [Ruminococcus sp.]MBR2284631.1 hypothetical protein [Ruminococcus sp.]